MQGEFGQGLTALHFVAADGRFVNHCEGVGANTCILHNEMLFYVTFLLSHVNLTPSYTKSVHSSANMTVLEILGENSLEKLVW